MKASLYLSVRTENEVAVIYSSRAGTTRMDFFGASCRASVRPMTRYLDSITISPEKGKDGVVAFSVEHYAEQKQGDYLKTTLFAPITWNGDKVQVNLDAPFVPHPDRLAQIECRDALVVTTKDQVFACRMPSVLGDKDTAKEKEALIKKGYRLVDDANLLCRFLVEQATLGDLEAAATLDKRSQMERELAECRNELEALRFQATEGARLTERLVEKTRLQSETCEGLNGELVEYKAELVKANTVVTNLAEKYAERGILLEEKKREIEECKVKFRKELAMHSVAVAQLKERENAIEGILLNRAPHHTLFGFLPWVKVKKIKTRLGISTREPLQKLKKMWNSIELAGLDD